MNVRNVRSVKRKIRQIERRVERQTKRASFSAMEQTTQVAHSQLVTGSNMWTGELAASLRTSMTPSTDGWSVRTKATAPHAAVVEFGSGQRYGDDPYPISASVPYMKAPYFSSGLIGAIWNWVQTKHPFFGSPTFNVAANIAQTVGRGSYEGLEGDGKGTNSHPYMRPAYFIVWGGRTGLSTSSGVRSIERAFKKAVTI